MALVWLGQAVGSSRSIFRFVATGPAGSVVRMRYRRTWVTDELVFTQGEETDIPLRRWPESVTGMVTLELILMLGERELVHDHISVFPASSAEALKIPRMTTLRVPGRFYGDAVVDVFASQLSTSSILPSDMVVVRRVLWVWIDPLADI